MTAAGPRRTLQSHVEGLQLLLKSVEFGQPLLGLGQPMSHQVAQPPSILLR